jgi:hypothetical protein
VTCAACKQTIEPVSIGGNPFCPECGARVQPAASHAHAKPGHHAKPGEHKPAPAESHHKTDDHKSEVAKLVAELGRKAPEVKPSHSVAEGRPRLDRETESPYAKASGLAERAHGTKRSQTLARFAHQTAAAQPLPKQDDKPANSDLAQVLLGELPEVVANQHAAMASLAQPKPKEPNGEGHRSRLSGQVRQVAIGLGVITIMGGYIWLQNAPKMAIQAAGHRAGVQAVLPTYIPGSYSLSRTDTAPGLVTLTFSSPASSDTLAISQRKTDWDSRSLLENFVGRQSRDYSTVEGQGLTIYLYGQNQAAWVNHGVQYTIAGVTRLNREQILKIAYGL